MEDDAINKSFRTKIIMVKMMKRYKKLQVVIALVLISVISLLPNCHIVVSSSYFTPITITNNISQELTNYQVKIELNSSNFDGWASITQESIYFLDAGGNPLYYWIEEFDATNQHAVIWVKVPTIPADGSVTINMYYGGTNPYTTYNNPELVFLFFDGFDGSTIDTSKWNIIVSGDISVSNGKLILAGGGDRGEITSKTTFECGIALHTKVKWSSSTAKNHHFASLRSPSDWNNRAGDVYGTESSNYAHFETWLNGVKTMTGVSLDSPTLYHTYIVIWGADKSKIYQDNTLLAEHTTNIPLTAQVIVFQEGLSNNVYVDYVFVRKYNDLEPSVTFGNSQTTSTTTTTTTTTTTSTTPTTTTTTSTTTTSTTTSTTTTSTTTTVTTVVTGGGGSGVVIIGGWGLLESIAPLLLIAVFGVAIVVIMRK